MKLKLISGLCAPIAAALYFGLAFLIGGLSVSAVIGAIVFGILVWSVIFIIGSAIRLAKNDQ